MLNYAEQRADGSITPEQQHKLNAPLEDEKQGLLEEKVMLTAKTQKIDEARQLLAYIEPVAKKLAERMPDLNDDEKAIFIHAACQRIWLGADNEPEIELSLPGLEAFLSNGLLGSQDSTPSPLPESEPLNDSPSEESDKTIDSRHWDLSNTARCRIIDAACWRSNPAAGPNSRGILSEMVVRLELCHWWLKPQTKSRSSGATPGRAAAGHAARHPAARRPPSRPASRRAHRQLSCPARW